MTLAIKVLESSKNKCLLIKAYGRRDQRKVIRKMQILKKWKAPNFHAYSILILNYVSSSLRSSSPSLSHMNSLFSLPSISFLRYAYKNSRKRTLRSCEHIISTFITHSFRSYSSIASSLLFESISSTFPFFFSPLALFFFFRNSPGEVMKSLVIRLMHLLTHLSGKNWTGA